VSITSGGRNDAFAAGEMATAAAGSAIGNRLNHLFMRLTPRLSPYPRERDPDHAEPATRIRRLREKPMSELHRKSRDSILFSHTRSPHTAAIAGADPPASPPRSYPALCERAADDPPNPCVSGIIASASSSGRVK